MSTRFFRQWAVGVVVFTMGVIIWGGYVRASGSGAGCGEHWPICRGEVIPRDPSVETLVELSHRVTSGLSFLALALTAWFARRSYPAGSAVRRWAGWAFVMMISEAAAGASLVLLGLTANDASPLRAVMMSVHLIITFTLLAFLALATWAAWSDSKEPMVGTPTGLSWLALVAVAVVGMSGAAIALGDTLTQQSVSGPLVDTLVRLRVFHPGLAMGATLAVIAVMVLGWNVERARRWAVAVGVLLVVLLVCGYVNVRLAAPVWIQMVHLFLADAFWVALVLLSAELAIAKRKPVSVAQPSAAGAV